MRNFKKIQFLPVLLVTTMLFAACGTQPTSEIKHITIVKAQTGSLLDSVRVSAPALGANSTELAFKSSGRVSDLNVRIGQFFKKWEAIARLSGEESRIAMVGSYAILGSLGASESNGSVRASLKQVRASTAELYKSRLAWVDADAASAEIRKRIAKNEAEFAKTNRDNIQAISSGSVFSSEKQREQAEEGLQLAKNQLDNTVMLLKNEETNLYRSSLASLENAFVVARSAREFEDMFLGISDENRSKNDSFEGYLDLYAKGNADTAFRNFDVKYLEMYDWYYANVANRAEVTPAVTKEALDRAIPTLESLRESLHAIKSVLEKAQASTAFPQSSIDAYQQKTNEWLTNVGQSLANASGGGVRANRLAIDVFENTRILKVTGLNDAVRLAQKNLELLQSGKNIATNASKKDLDALSTEVIVKRQAVELSQQALEWIKAARLALISESKSKLAELDAQIAQADTQIAQARMQGSLAENEVENQLIRAPFDGMVFAKSADIGSVINAGTPIVSFTSNIAVRAIFSVSAPMSEWLLSNSGSVVLSHENGDTFTGTIIVKNTIRDAVSNTVKIEVTFDKGAVQVGERIWLNPRTEGPVGSIVPTKSIITKYSIPSVYVYNNGKVVLTQIRIIRTHQDQTLIEDLESGTFVVVDGKDRLLDGEIISSEWVKTK